MVATATICPAATLGAPHTIGNISPVPISTFVSVNLSASGCLVRTKHPDADKLSLTKVDIGTGELLPIVCGAPNVAAGQKVAVATIGTKLYFNNEEIVIKKGKIRGQESFGMICAEDEVGLVHRTMELWFFIPMPELVCLPVNISKLKMILFLK